MRPLLLWLLGLILVEASRYVRTLAQQVVETTRRGVVVTLIRTRRKVDEYLPELVGRNKAIEQHLYWNDSKKSLVDVVVFHEGNLPVTHQSYIQSHTPTMPISFVDVGAVFSLYKYTNSPFCPNQPIIMGMFPAGYRSMCLFWFAKFRDYVLTYDWMARIDEDCILSKNIRNSFRRITNRVHFGSVAWMDLSKGSSDGINATFEGGVVTGMRTLATKFAKTHNLQQSVNSWFAPYTNVMYIDLNWLRNNTIINEFTQAVVESQCIYSNRWGDLPLWGAALHLAGAPHHHLRWPYYHGSHKTLINGSSAGLNSFI